MTYYDGENDFSRRYALNRYVMIVMMLRRIVIMKMIIIVTAI